MKFVKSKLKKNYTFLHFYLQCDQKEERMGKLSNEMEIIRVR